MTKLFGFGKCSKYYLYILCTIILKIIKDLIFGFSYIDSKISDKYGFFNSLLSII